jgi:hypothetical protein
MVHNFGAVTLFSACITYILLGKKSSEDVPIKLLRIALIGWIIQGLSGTSFGLASYSFYHRFPQIGLIGVISLIIKIISTFTGFLLTAYFLMRGSDSYKTKAILWYVILSLAATALSAAAILRWFS